MSELIKKAKEWAHAAHDSIGQKRNYGGHNYWVHTDAVAEALKRAGESDVVVAAGEIHDVFEDVSDKSPDYSIENARKLFGDKVVDLALEVTNVYTKEKYSEFNRSKRKHLEHKRLSNISKEAKSIKLADIGNNADGISDTDFSFAKVWLTEAAQLLLVLKEGNSTLYKEAVRVVTQEISKLRKS